MAKQFSGIIVMFATFIMCQVVTSLEASVLVKTSPIIMAHAMMHMQAPPTHPTKQQSDDRAKNEMAFKDVQVLRDSFLMLWVCGGILPGSVVGAILRKVNREKLWLDMSLSACTALPLTPFLLRQYTDCSPEVCFLGGFIVSVCAWSAWTIALILVSRLTKAADSGGIGGMKDELLGKGSPQQRPFAGGDGDQKISGGK